MTDIQDPQEAKTRSNLAYIFAIGAIIMLGYILYRWGDKMEILTLVIGLIGGTLLGGVSAVYFGGSTIKKSDPNPSVPVTGDNPTVNVTPAPDNNTTTP